MNAHLLARAEAAVLGIGTAFSWLTLAGDYGRFFAAGGRVFELSGCAVANPLATPCFYGAIAFLAALAWSIVAPGRGLVWLLAAGTLFAWGNFAYEAYRYYAGAPAAALSCPPSGAAVHPLALPCFYGALLFLAALVLDVLLTHVKNDRVSGNILAQ